MVPVAYSTMTLQYDTSSFISFDPSANLDLSGATIELSGGTAMTIDLQSFSVVSRSVVVGTRWDLTDRAGPNNFAV